MNRFSACKTIEEAKTIFRAEAHNCHPDHGGSGEDFKALINEYEFFLNCFVADRFAEAGERTGNTDHHVFQDILNEIIHFNMNIEIIGFWIYATSSYDYKDQLKELGFWFSSKHKAWVFNGGSKKRRASKYSIDEIRRAYGSDTVSEEEDRKAVGG